MVSASVVGMVVSEAASAVAAMFSGASVGDDLECWEGSVAGGVSASFASGVSAGVLFSGTSFGFDEAVSAGVGGDSKCWGGSVAGGPSASMTSEVSAGLIFSGTSFGFDEVVSSGVSVTLGLSSS